MYRLTTTMMIVALGLGSQLTHAAPPQDVHFIDVHFADLDLTRSEGAAVPRGAEDPSRTVHSKPCAEGRRRTHFGAAR